MTYVMSDIHGNISHYRSIMEQIQLQPEDTLYILGDVIDRYPDGIRILRKLMAMPNVKMLLGNHEYMMLNALDEPEQPDILREHSLRLWYRNGGAITHTYIKHIKKTIRREVFDFLRSLPLNIDIEINGNHYLLVHGSPAEWAGPYLCRYRSPEEFAVWYRMTPAAPSIKDTTIIFGHTPTSEYQDKNPLEIWSSPEGGKIGIDCGCGFPLPQEQGCFPLLGRLACIRLEDMKAYYSKDYSEEEVEETWEKV